MLWLLLFLAALAAQGAADLSARVLTCLGGYLRTRPDPRLEHRLRHALAEFDRELMAILHDKPALR